MRGNFSLLKYAALVILLFTTSSILIYLHAKGSFDDYDAAQSVRGRVRDIENNDDYDSACSGHAYGEIIRTQKRILASLRKELLESQSKLDEVMKIHGELQRLIPQRQLELSTVEGEIEAAQRQLEEWRENRNVKVFLPLSPLEVPKSASQQRNSSPLSFEDLIDYSRCSITSFMPVFLSDINENWTSLINGTENVVNDASQACWKVYSDTENVKENGNILVFNHGNLVSNFSGVVVQPFVEIYRRKIDIAAVTDVELFDENSWQTFPPILPFSREIFLNFITQDSTTLPIDKLKTSGIQSEDKIEIRRCSDGDFCMKNSAQRVNLYRSSIFCVLMSSGNVIYQFYDSLRTTCVPVILGDVVLPFEETIDWRLASVRLPVSRFTEVHFILRSFEMADVLEMRRKGRIIYEKYLADREALVRTVFALLRYRLQLPTREPLKGHHQARPLFKESFTPPSGIPSKHQNPTDDGYLGPLESPYNSPTFTHNFSSLGLYSHRLWNQDFSPWSTPEFMIGAHELPTEAEFFPDSGVGFRPIEPGSGVEFSKALGGNQAREQFTIVLLTYERDATLAEALERFYQLPYLNKVIVIWNSVEREPPETWPTLHVPIEFIKVDVNSLNNRFIPWDRIETEAALSLDDDIDLMQQELVLAFRVWRENRDRIVGFPARHHARYGDSMFYNSNHTCQLSMILTGAAFLHKNYLHEYTNNMPEVIRQRVDEVQNCEDIAMNFLVSHLTRKPPIKTTSRWTLKCATCTEALSQSESHFTERHDCIRYFSQVYGYNPLKFSQFRADSILFKTRLPQQHQKCFTYV